MSDTTCLIEDCEAQPISRGWCTMHYQRWQKHGDPMGGKHRRRKSEPRPSCSVDGCDKPVKGRGWCGAHYRRWRVNGDPGPAEMRYQPFHPDMTEKRCTRCKLTKPLSEFHRVNRASQYVARCKACVQTITAKYQRKRLYGLTDAEYIAMQEAQGGACAICGSTKRLCIDHDHASGDVRKLLCDMCNKALGMAEDDPARLRAMADYLDMHRSTA